MIFLNEKFINNDFKRLIMKYRNFQQNKLWRDKAIDMAQSKGSRIHWNRLNDVEFEQQLKIKFMEEAAEVCAAKDKQALIEEFADILEVINAFAHLHNFTMQDVINVQRKKFQERGGFQGRKFVTIAQHPVNSPLVQYCLREPEKYPEIID